MNGMGHFVSASSTKPVDDVSFTSMVIKLSDSQA
jgi:hypothetical protein